MKSYVSSLAAALVLIACSGSSTSNAPKSDVAATEPAPPPAAAPESTPPAAPAADPGPTTPAKTGECASETTKDTCSQCCAKKHQDGAAAYIGAAMECLCQADTCGGDCADTFCNADNPKNPDASCNACIQQKNTTCSNDIQTACAAEPDCGAFDTCIADSGCLSK